MTQEMSCGIIYWYNTEEIMAEENAIITKLTDYFNQITENASIIRGVYTTVILITGFMVLSYLTQTSPPPFGMSVGFMVAWLVLISTLDPPPLAKMKSKPFEDTGILREEKF